MVATGSVAVAAHGAYALGNSAANLQGSYQLMMKRWKGNPNDDDGEPNFKKNPEGDNTKVNDQVTSLYSQYKLSKEQQRKLHDAITKKGLTRYQIEDVLLEMFPEKRK